MLGASESAWKQLAMVLPTEFHEEQEQTIAAARAVLDGELFDSLRAEGQAMSLEQAVAYAMEECLSTGGAV